ncbi:hypothetical protein [Ensifer sp. 4252]|uniref:hypothetical protein n=1 Tax=Ensifer sp. 4252 TaxID=3373915 RepID=UPI003D253DAA
MLSALRSIIRHARTLARRAADVTTTIDTFSEFQLRDIGLTRDNERILARAGDIAVPWQRVTDPDPGNAPSPLVTDDGVVPVQTTCRDAMPRPATVNGLRSQMSENKDIYISLYD